MSLSQRLRLAARSLMARSHATRDPNFIGFDKYLKHGAYHWRELAESAEYRSKVDLIRPYLTPDGTCLDVGCGDAAYVYALSGDTGLIVGIDADFHAVQLANRELRSHGAKNALCLQLPISAVSRQALDAPEGFDVVYSMDVIEHLPEPEQLLVAVDGVMRSDGVAIIGTPLYIRDALVSEYHVKEFRREEIRDLLTSTFAIETEFVLPMTRLDGECHDQGFYVAVCRGS